MLSVNLKGNSPRECFNRQPIGEKSFGTIVKNACIVKNICSSGTKHWVTSHGLRGIQASILFEAGNSESSVAMRTGHRDPKSLKSYQNLRGREGKDQQLDLLGGRNINHEIPTPPSATRLPLKCSTSKM